MVWTLNDFNPTSQRVGTAATRRLLCASGIPDLDGQRLELFFAKHSYDGNSIHSGFLHVQTDSSRRFLNESLFVQSTRTFSRIEPRTGPDKLPFALSQLPRHSVLFLKFPLFRECNFLVEFVIFLTDFGEHLSEFTKKWEHICLKKKAVYWIYFFWEIQHCLFNDYYFEKKTLLGFYSLLLIRLD